MKQALDQLLLQYVHGDLGVAGRLRVRLELMTNRRARKRVQEFVVASEAFAAALSPIGGAAFHAARAVRQLRQGIIDGLVALALLGALTGGVVFSIRHWPGASCETGTPVGAQPVSTQAAVPGKTASCKSTVITPATM